MDRLARWRLLTNEAVAPGCLRPRGAAWARERAIAQLRGIITGYGCDWLTATDEFYLRERLARWAGLPPRWSREARRPGCTRTG